MTNKFIIIATTILLIAFTAKAQDGNQSVKWYTGDYLAEVVRSSALQPLMFDVHGKYKHSIKQEKLNDVQVIGDVIPDFPSTWISKFVYVEISANNNGKRVKAVSNSATLTVEQKKILKTVELATEIEINIKYKFKNAVTDQIEESRMYISFTAVPEKEAEYVGGYPKMSKYLRENLITKMADLIPVEYQKGVVEFTVDDNGEIVNAKIAQSSGDQKTDKFLIEEISKMPHWKPAMNAGGQRVKQDFVFTVGLGGC